MAGASNQANMWYNTRRSENEDVGLKEDVDALKEEVDILESDLVTVKSDILDEQLNEASEPLVPAVVCFQDEDSIPVPVAVVGPDPLDPVFSFILESTFVIPQQTTVVKIIGSVSMKELSGFAGDATLRIRVNGILEQLKWRATIPASGRVSISGTWQLTGLIAGPNSVQMDVIVDGTAGAAADAEDYSLLTQIKFNVQT